MKVKMENNLSTTMYIYTHTHIYKFLLHYEAKLILPNQIIILTLNFSIENNASGELILFS